MENIKVENGKARPVNPHSYNSEVEHSISLNLYSAWSDFESTVQWYDCPGCEDGEYWGELVWQYKNTDGEWVDALWETWFIDTNPEMYRPGYWRIVPQPQEKQTMKTDFQLKVLDWLIKCFGIEISKDILERNDRFIEEALELTQSLNYSAERAHALVDYVYGRDKGEPFQEVGGVMVTLAALCSATGLNMMMDGETEFARIDTPEMIEKIRKKQASKPVGSALPIPTTQQEEAKTVEGNRRLICRPILRPIDILREHSCSIGVLKDVHNRDGKLGNELDRIIEAMQAYSSQRNIVLMEENERLRDALEYIANINCHYELSQKTATEALKPKQ